MQSFPLENAFNLPWGAFSADPYWARKDKAERVTLAECREFLDVELNKQLAKAVVGDDK